MSDSEYRIPDHPGKDPAETIPVTIDLFALCANYRLPNEQYALGEFVRPEKASGFALECTTPGTTAVREPRVVGPAGTTILDGSVIWTVRAAGNNGVNAASNPSAESDPPGLTIGDLSVEESTKLLATYSGGTEGDIYDAVFTFTLDGVPRVARQSVPVRRR